MNWTYEMTGHRSRDVSWLFLLDLNGKSFAGSLEVVVNDMWKTRKIECFRTALPYIPLTFESHVILFRPTKSTLLT